MPSAVSPRDEQEARQPRPTANTGRVRATRPSATMFLIYLQETHTLKMKYNQIREVDISCAFDRGKFRPLRGRGVYRSGVSLSQGRGAGDIFLRICYRL